jgi:tRNA threonylcarbamoyladenosine biosynthesis protein TsaB
MAAGQDMKAHQVIIDTLAAMSLPMPVLLSLDTATDRLHLALSVGEALYTRDLPGGAQASATLLPALAELLAQAQRSWQDVDAIAFGRGPGAFTGLRTAASVAQGLALALDCPVIALDTLMAVAEDARLAQPEACSPGTVCWVLQDARMDELYASAFQWGGQHWAEQEPARLWPLAQGVPPWLLGGTAPWAGNACQAYPTHLAALLPGQMLVGGLPAAPRAPALASLAQRAWARGDTLDAALALPCYVRDKVAQTTAERLQGRQASQT